MSYIIFDYACKNCGVEVSDKMVLRSEMDKQQCEHCDVLLHRMPAGPTTTFKFGDRSATKSKKAVSLRDPTGSGHGKTWDIDG